MARNAGPPGQRPPTGGNCLVRERKCRGYEANGPACLGGALFNEKVLR